LELFSIATPTTTLVREELCLLACLHSKLLWKMPKPLAAVPIQVFRDHSLLVNASIPTLRVAVVRLRWSPQPNVAAPQPKLLLGLMEHALVDPVLVLLIAPVERAVV